MSSRRQGTLIIIGGHEDKENEQIILKELAHRVGSGKLVLSAIGSAEPEHYIEKYNQVLRNLGVRHIYNLSVALRAEAREESKLRILDDAAAVFFTGGDQLKITSQLGDTPIYSRIVEIYEQGGLIAGTSAGASILCETMMVGGDGDGSHKIRESLHMAPGLGLIKNVVIDQHFAERGRMGRLLEAVAQNPKNLGLGIDENTAVIVERERSFYVLGAGAVYAVDGSGVTESNMGVEEEGRSLSIYDVKLHVLSQGDSFDLNTRRPRMLPARQAEEKRPKEKPEGEKAKAKGQDE